MLLRNLPNINGRRVNQQLSRPVSTKEPKRPPESVSDEEILELRQKGYGYERISKELNCTVYRVRQCLAGEDPMDES